MSAAVRRGRALELPLQTYQCSTIGCTHAMSFVRGVVTRDYAVELLRRGGWQLFIGEAICPRCWAGRTDLEGALRASLAVVRGGR